MLHSAVCSNKTMIILIDFQPNDENNLRQKFPLQSKDDCDEMIAMKSKSLYMRQDGGDPPRV